jgi:signal transduction histidine kinase
MGSSFNVAGDRDELTRLFDHLVDNALKYGAAAKRVELKLCPAETAKGSPFGQKIGPRVEFGKMPMPNG